MKPLTLDSALEMLLTNALLTVAQLQVNAAPTPQAQSQDLAYTRKAFLSFVFQLALQALLLQLSLQDLPPLFKWASASEMLLKWSP